MKVKNKHIGFNEPSITKNEYNYIKDALKNKQLSASGIFTKKCNNLFEKKLGVKKSILTSSCTHALEAASFLININPKDEVIVPSFTFVSTANAFAIRGAKPVFIDIREDTLNMDEKLLKNLITENTKAIIPAEKLSLLKSQIAYCEKLVARLKDGDLKAAVPEGDKKAFFDHLEKSEVAFAKQHYWRARIELMYPEMVAVFENTGKFPEGQYHRNMPTKLDLAKTGPGQLPAGEVFTPQALLSHANGKAKLVKSESFNPDWNGDDVLKVTGDKINFKLKLECDGLYKVNIGIVGPSRHLTRVLT